MSDHDYCKLYLQSDQSFEGLKSAISMILSSPVVGRTIEGSSMLIDCFVNKASDDGGADFLNWPYYLEVEAPGGLEGTEFVRHVQSLIDALKSESMQVVPSCDFEDELRA